MVKQKQQQFQAIALSAPDVPSSASCMGLRGRHNRCLPLSHTGCLTRYVEFELASHVGWHGRTTFLGQASHLAYDCPGFIALLHECGSLIIWQQLIQGLHQMAGAPQQMRGHTARSSSFLILLQQAPSDPVMRQQLT